MTLKNEAEYQAALVEAGAYFDGQQPKPVPARFHELMDMIDAYEREFYPEKVALDEAWMNFPGPDPDSPL